MLRILLCEDELSYIKDFVTELGGEYSKECTLFECGEFRIEVCHDLNILDRMLRNEPLPDLLVLDLYWPKTPGRARQDFEEAIGEFNRALNDLVKKVPEYVTERGYRFCDEIRRHMNISIGDLPILLYTKAGQYVLDAHQRTRLIEDNIHFLLKRDDPETKKALMRQCVRRWKYKKDVFVSHASGDAELIQEIVDTLKGYKLRVFSSPQMRAGDWFNEEILDNIEATKVVAVIWSKTALESKYVMLEVGAGLGLRKKIVPACVGMEPDQLPNFIMARIHCRRIDSKQAREKYINDIIQKCAIDRVERDENVLGHSMGRRT